MIDYLNFGYNLSDTLGVFTTSSIIDSIILIIGILIGAIVILGVMTSMEEYGFKFFKNGSIIITAIVIIISIVSFGYNPTRQIAKKDILNQGITETVDFESLKAVNTLHADISHRDSPAHFQTEYSKQTYKPTSIKDNQVAKALEVLNIKSINNFTSNVLYLSKYYDEHFGADPHDYIETKYDWINEKLNAFYMPAEDTNINSSSDEILKNLKN